MNNQIEILLKSRLCNARMLWNKLLLSEITGNTCFTLATVRVPKCFENVLIIVSNYFFLFVLASWGGLPCSWSVGVE